MAQQDPKQKSSGSKQGLHVLSSYEIMYIVRRQIRCARDEIESWGYNRHGAEERVLWALKKYVNQQGGTEQQNPNRFESHGEAIVGRETFARKEEGVVRLDATTDPNDKKITPVLVATKDDPPRVDITEKSTTTTTPPVYTILDDVACATPPQICEPIPRSSHIQKM